MSAALPLGPLVLAALVGVALLALGASDRPSPPVPSPSTSSFKALPSKWAVFTYPYARDPAYQEGRERARRDLVRGTPRWISTGYPRESHPIFGELLQARYGIRVEVAGRPILGRAETAERFGYDDVIESYLDAIHGPGTIEALSAEADARWRAERPAREAERRRFEREVERMVRDMTVPSRPGLDSAQIEDE